MRRACLAVALFGLGGCDDDPAPRPADPVDTEAPTDDDDLGTTTSPDPGTTAPGTTGPDPSTTTAPGSTTDPGTTDPSTTDAETSTGSPSDPCEGDTQNITQEGNVLASSVFDSLLGPAYEPELGIDGDISTSWFSAGPNEDGTASTFEWYTQFDHCIDGIALLSNAMHANPDFREGFGFESGTLEVLNTSGVVVYTQDLDLSGTPDPDLTFDPEGVLGNQIRLTLRDHESEDCGGFAELAIDGRAQR
jgi:hypothetical protein